MEWLKSNHRQFPVVVDSTVMITPTFGGNSFHGPLTHWYGFQRVSNLYLSSETDFVGLITELEYRSTTDGVAKSVPTKVYMKSTDLTSLMSSAWNSSFYTGGAALTLDENTDQGNTPGWKALTLTTPFEYAEGNLMIMVYDA